MSEDREGVERFMTMGKIVFTKLEGDKQHLLEVSSALEHERRENERLNMFLHEVKAELGSEGSEESKLERIKQLMESTQ